MLGARSTARVQLVLDVGVWATAVIAASFLRLDFTLAGLSVVRLVGLVTLVAIVQTLGGLGLGLYRQRWRFGSIDEVGALIQSVAVTTSVAFVASYFLDPRPTPLSAVLSGGVLGLIGMFAIRYSWRLLYGSWNRPDLTNAKRLIVFGAGEAGAEMVRSFLHNPKSPFVPVAILDDSPEKQRYEVARVKVMGTRADLEKVVVLTGAESLLIAMPTATRELIRELNDKARDLKLDVKVLPPAAELFGETLSFNHIREITDADLMGRQQVETDMASIAGYLRGKRILVTGAGGSIGSELCRQLTHFGPEALLMLDRDESALHAVQLSIEGRALLDSPHLLLADIRDSNHLTRLFQEHRPQVVFHAAALKHLSLLEMHPAEALKSNVWGTENVLKAASTVGVERFVNISTDKAANPTSVLGYSKRIGERLTAHQAMLDPLGQYMSVRFGNVLGSRGSMLPAFKMMIARGGPVTVTHPEVTRFFMTIPEAVQLVIQAGALGNDGEVLVLDMGTPVKIDDVARRLIRESGSQIDVVYSGLRPGEKLHEELFGDDERDVRTMHPLISHAPVPALAPETTRTLDPEADHDVCLIGLMNLAVLPATDNVVLPLRPLAASQTNGPEYRATSAGR